MEEIIAMAKLPKIALGAWAIAKGTLPIIGVTKENQVLDAVKAVNVTLTAEETEELEKVADSLELNVIRFWEKEMK
jgi:aryl-alcohol dehydrogenase-like predicted oxidoreductase